MATASCRLLVVAVVASLCAAVAAGQKNDRVLLPAWPSCSVTGNYTDGSQYKKNLDQLLAALPSTAGDNGWFYKGSVGAGVDEVFGLVMCFADHNATQCLDCLSRAPAGITTVCPGSRNASAAYDACALRYSDMSFSSVVDDASKASYVFSSGSVDQANLDGAHSSVMNQLTEMPPPLVPPQPPPVPSRRRPLSPPSRSVSTGLVVGVSVAGAALLVLGLTAWLISLKHRMHRLMTS